MHSRHDGREEAIHSGKEGPVGRGGGSTKGRDQATHTCPGGLPPAVPALQQPYKGTRKAEGGQRTLDPPPGPRVPRTHDITVTWETLCTLSCGPKSELSQTSMNVNT